MSHHKGDYKLYIEDITVECQNIRKFINGIDYDEFTENLDNEVIGDALLLYT